MRHGGVSEPETEKQETKNMEILNVNNPTTPTMTTPFNPDLASPFPPDHGRAAYNCIMKFLKARKLTNTGGCKAFYTPQQWASSGVWYGGDDAVLIVVHDRGDLANCFNDESPLYQKMSKHLEDNGFWAEALTCWATAIYR